MRRSLGVVLLGWAVGFLVAVAWGATGGHDARMASNLWLWAVTGLGLTSLLLAVTAASARAERRRSQREREQRRAAAAKAVKLAEGERRAAARIAQLEARLAREQAELEAASAALGATDQPPPEEEVELPPEAAGQEGQLREEIVERLAALVSQGEPVHATELAGQLRARAKKSR